MKYIDVEKIFFILNDSAFSSAVAEWIDVYRVLLEATTAT